jgi:ubiquitin-activating enzyme E1
MTAGRIIPAIPSTTAAIAGIASMQIYSFLQDYKNNISHLRNSFINLGIGLILLTEPFNLTKTKTNNLSIWDKLEILGPLTIKEFINYFIKNYDMKINHITTLSSKNILNDENLEDQNM